MDVNHTAIRNEGRQAGYNSRVTKTFMPNPHVPGTIEFDHWFDGYELGVLDADTSMTDNDNFEHGLPSRYA